MTPRRKKRVAKKIRFSVPAPPEKHPAHLILILAAALNLSLFGANLSDAFIGSDAALVHSALSGGHTGFGLLGDLFFRLESTVFGYGPTGYHLIGFALHLLCGFLIYSLGRRILTPTFAALAAAVYLLAPSATSAMIQIPATVEIAGACAALSAGLFFLKGLAGLEKRHYLLSAGFAGAAVLISRNGLAAPVMILILAALYGPSSVWNNLIGRIKIAVLPVGISAAAISLQFLLQGIPLEPYAGRALFIDTASRAIPAALFSPVIAEALPFASDLLSTALFVLGWTALPGLILFRKSRRVWIGLLFFMAATFPIAYSGNFAPGFDSLRLLPLPAAGFFLFVAGMIEKATQRKKLLGRAITLCLGLWLLPMPLLSLFNARALNQAAEMSLALGSGMAAAIAESPSPGPVYCRDFPNSIKGVTVFTDPALLLLPYDAEKAKGRFLQADENLMHDADSLAPFRIAAMEPGFFDLSWQSGAVIDLTATTRKLMESIEKSETLQKINLKIVDKQPESWNLKPPTLEIQGNDQVPATAITRLCLNMRLKTPAGSGGVYYNLTWVTKDGARTLSLPYKPYSDGYTCADLEKDPYWATAGYITELYVTPTSYRGEIFLDDAEFTYRTTLVEITEEIVLDANDPLLQSIIEMQKSGEVPSENDNQGDE